MVTARKDMESWRNVMEGTVFVRLLDHRGEMTRIEHVIGGRTFHLSPEERRINQELAASAEQDFFRNGMLQPVRLLDDSEEARELASNPNVMSESDMAALLKAHPKTFEKRLSEINNTVTLERLLRAAHDEDATVRRVEAIKDRLASLGPAAFTEVTVTSAAGPERRTRAVTPR